MNERRQRIIAVLVLAGQLAACVGLVGFAWQVWSDANADVELRQDLVSRLGRQAPAELAKQQRASAPPLAFLDAGTEGLAAAQLQSYVARIAAGQGATLISSAVEPLTRTDAPNSVRTQVTLDVNAQTLQGVLHQLEIGTPYVFVDALAVQPTGTSAVVATENPLLRTTLSLRGIRTTEAR